MKIMHYIASALILALDAWLALTSDRTWTELRTESRNR